MRTSIGMVLSQREVLTLTLTQTHHCRLKDTIYNESKARVPRAHKPLLKEVCDLHSLTELQSYTLVAPGREQGFVSVWSGFLLL